jgi:hypothetical protein
MAIYIKDKNICEFALSNEGRRFIYDFINEKENCKIEFHDNDYLIKYSQGDKYSIITIINENEICINPFFHNGVDYTTKLYYFIKNIINSKRNEKIENILSK